jgi:hypothetical protein
MSDDRKKWPAAQDEESEDVEAHVKTNRGAAAAAANDEGDDSDDVEAHVKPGKDG